MLQLAKVKLTLPRNEVSEEDRVKNKNNILRMYLVSLILILQFIQ